MTRKRKFFAILIASSIITVCLVGITTLRTGTGSRECMKCGWRETYSYIRVFGFPLKDVRKEQYCGTPQLKEVQRTCDHLCVGRGRWRYGLTREFGHSSLSKMYSWAVSTERYGLELVFQDMVDLKSRLDMVDLKSHKEIKDSLFKAKQAALEKEYAFIQWFIQQATGRDFGITFDEEEWQPKPHDTAYEGILSWWETEGKDLYSFKRSQAGGR